MVRLTDRPAMTIAVDLGRKATKQPTNQLVKPRIFIQVVWKIYNLWNIHIEFGTMKLPVIFFY